MKKHSSIVASMLMLAASAWAGTADYSGFVGINGPDLVKPDGSVLYIQGTNLGQWLNPEGYMFGFKRTNSARAINDAICELIGPDEAAEFWAKFKDNYITRDDIDFIAAQGANTIRLPFHYKLFTNEDYMGLTENQDGFARVDSVINWARDNGLYVILDMHDCPGGQTGDNIDDSYGYPWLLVSEKSQQKFCDVWRKIAERYRDEKVILGYELMNEPIAHYFADKDTLNSLLEPLMIRGVKAIREVDPNHIIVIGGAQWNGNFKPLKRTDYDDKIIFSCHIYHCGTSAESIRHFINARDAYNLPMFMGETGHEGPEWQTAFVKTMKENNIGYTFWPYKKLDGSCMNAVNRPQGWESVVNFVEAPRATYAEIRAATPASRDTVRAALAGYLENVKFEKCVPQHDYIESLSLTTGRDLPVAATPKKNKRNKKK